MCLSIGRNLGLETSPIILAAAALLSLSGPLGAGAAGVEGLAQDAELIAAVRILSVDDTAMSADGPMYVEARVLKLVKGNPRVGPQIRFGSSAWVGPTYRPGEERVVFLAPVPSGHTYYDKARWSSVEAGKVDVFFAHGDLKNCSEAALIEFLRMIEIAGRSPPKLESKLVRNAASTQRLSVNLVNESNQTVWLNPSKVMTSFEANQVRHALPIRWNRGGGGEWITLQAGSTLSGNVSVDTEDLDGARELIITLGHAAAQFPHPSWVGFRSVSVRIQE